MKKQILLLSTAMLFVLSASYRICFASSVDESISESYAEELSSSEGFNELTHYEDDYVEFDYDENAGISISRFAGSGFVRYTFSDVNELANSGATAQLQILINTQSIVSIESYIDSISDNDEFEELDGGLSYMYESDGMRVAEFVSELSDEYYVSVKYSTDAESITITQPLNEILKVFEFKNKFDSEIPTGRPKTLNICEWYYVPEEWILDDVEAAINICKQYRSMKLSLDETTDQIQEICDLLDGTDASYPVNMALLALKYDTSNLSDAVASMELFVEKQIDQIYLEKK